MATEITTEMVQATLNSHAQHAHKDCRVLFWKRSPNCDAVHVRCSCDHIVVMPTKRVLAGLPKPPRITEKDGGLSGLYYGANRITSAPLNPVHPGDEWRRSKPKTDWQFMYHQAEKHCGQLVKERDALRAQHDLAQKRNDELVKERDALHQAYLEAETAVEGLIKDRNELRAELQMKARTAYRTEQSKHDALLAEWERKPIEQRVAECDAMLAKLTARERGFAVPAEKAKLAPFGNERMEAASTDPECYVQGRSIAVAAAPGIAPKRRVHRQTMVVRYSEED